MLWLPGKTDQTPQLIIGTFQDVRALVDLKEQSPNFPHTEILNQGHALIAELGVNAIELLPPADSWQEREWGYGTCNYLSPCTDLSRPASAFSST